MLQADKVRSSEQGKLNLKTAYKSAKLTQEELAERANVSVDTIKRLLGTKKCPNGVERWAVLNICKVLEIQPTDIVDPKEWNGQQQHPSEFEALIKDKTRNFCGREFVFAEFEKFMREKSCGYFTVVADAGMGKSAIAAKYVWDTFVPCYFNVLAERRNTPEQFLRSIRQQLIQRYELQNAEADDLPTLLAKVAQKLTDAERLIVVVDALDEVEQEPGDNLLHLPTTLPEGVYFLLTRRPYTLEKKRLFVSPGVPEAQLDLTASEYEELSEADVKAYIRLFINEDPDYKEALRQWMQQRQISPQQFIDCVAEKSQNNFMYLRYVLPAIAKGQYDDLELKDLPEGLEGYYQQHWVRMGMETAPGEFMTIVLFILVESGTPIPSEMVAGIAEADEYEVQKVLDRWVEYLSDREIEGELCYSIYHTSFLDFLKKKRELKKTRKLFEEVNRRIVEYLEGEMA